MIKDYLNLPENVEGIGEIYPISILEWEEFHPLAKSFLLVDYDYLKYRLKVEKEIKLMDFLIAMCLSSEDEEERLKNMTHFKRLIEMPLRKETQFVFDERTQEWFFLLSESENPLQINRHNFDQFREVVMRQNLLFAPVTAPNPYAQQVLDEAIERMNRQGSPVDLESMLVVVSLMRGLTPDHLNHYSYYQLRADYEVFQRIENHRITHLYRCQGGKGDDIELVSPLSIHENPFGFDRLLSKVDNQKDQELQKALSR